MNRHLVQLAAISLTVALLLARCAEVPTYDPVDGGGTHDAGQDGGAVDGLWVDSTTGLWWQNPGTEKLFTFDEAIAYCEGLKWSGQDDWRLPTIGELRSLIRGCPGTQTDGACGVTDSCMTEYCFGNECRDCPFSGGPGKSGCYWDVALGGSCQRMSVPVEGRKSLSGSSA